MDKGEEGCPGPTRGRVDSDEDDKIHGMTQQQQPNMSKVAHYFNNVSIVFT